MAAIRREEVARLAGSKEYENYILRARTRFENGQAATVRDLRKVYRRAAEEIRRDIQGLTSGTLREAHLAALATNLERRARELNEQVLDLAHKGIYLSVEAGASAPRDICAKLLHDEWPDAEVARLFAPINERATISILSRTGKDGLKLSDRVWRIGERYRNAVQRLVEDGVARGLDSRKLAREVQQYLEPGKWSAMKIETRRRLGVSKDVSYDGMRLARTEMNNAYHEAAIMANGANPGYRGIYWRLSTSHAAPDKCDDMAVEMKFGEQGFYPRGKEPSRPHPQCMCVVIPAYEDPADFAGHLAEWVENPDSQPDIESWYNRVAKESFDRRGRPRQRSGSGQVPQGPWSKHDWSRGLLDSVNQIADDLQLKTVETRVEWAALVDFDDGSRVGNVLRGKQDSVDVRELLREMRPGKRYVLVHTHPGSSSFSDQDLNLLYYHQGGTRNIKTMLVAGEDGTRYVASRKRYAEIADPGTISAAYFTEVKRLRPEWEGKFRSGELTIQQAWKEHTHAAWTNISDALGIIYDRVVGK